MKTSRVAIICTSVVAIALVVMAFVVATNWQWYGLPARIESHLLSETPLGSSETNIISHLCNKGVRFKQPWRGVVEPNTGYPPNTVAGSSFIRALAAEYGIVFVTSVEAFYIFNSDRQLVEIAVRKTTDAL